jgi:CheY-like chemotaxis protein
MKPAHILIIDDDAGVRGVLKALLERGGYRVTAGSSGAEGLDLARAELPDLVLLDIEMPGMNGFDVCSVFKTDTALREVPVVIMTGRAIVGIPARVDAVGALGLLPKPFEREKLLKSIRGYLGGAGTRDAAQ